MRRRAFITLLGGAAAAWPLVASAQQPAMPVIGFLDSRSSDGMATRLAAFRQGLKEVGLVEGENVTIIYRWAEGRVDRLPEMASELARQATVIVTSGGPPAAFAAKAATTTPIVFLVGEDPTRLGLVTSLARPSGNLTGINMLANELEAKRLQFLHQLVPQAQRIAVLVNPNSLIYTETTLRDVDAAARTIGLQLQVLKANTAREIEEGFAWSERQRPDALFVGATAFLNIRRVQLVQLAAFHRLPATYGQREAAEAGGLMSYGPSILEGYRQWAIYAGRVLKGAKPGELPVAQSTKFELVINNTTARMFRLTVPPSLLAIADEVIE
ncbi:MAG: ABC transporter substrate-binding protein [Alphaproteobacteria bacterium]|nr:MAG: ABC transporter substrate-binding protein [Alphaproteobacteria bacterium]